MRTEEAYVYWIRRLIVFHGKRHPRELGEREVTDFLTHLAVDAKVAPSTQNQALSAMLFLYREVLGRELGSLAATERPSPGVHLPVVLTPTEIQRLLNRLSGVPRLAAGLLYGSGLRLMECLRLRVKDVDLERREVLVREGKGAKDRVTMLPDALAEPLRRHLEAVKTLHESDLAKGLGAVFLPHALASKYPGAGREWGWQWMFPAARLSVDPRSGQVRRHHLHESILQREVKAAVRMAGILKPASCHTLRPQLRDSPARVGLRHPYRPGAARPSGCDDHDDLHSCSQSWRSRRAKPARPTVVRLARGRRIRTVLSLARARSAARLARRTERLFSRRPDESAPGAGVASSGG